MQHPPVPEDTVVALDPGVRKFLTAYDPNGAATIIGTNTTSVLNGLTKQITVAKQRLKTITPKPMGRQEKRKWRLKVKKLKAKHYKAETRAKNVVKDIHYKVAHWLLRRYKTIILPYTSSHQWRTGSLHASVKKRAMLLSFGKFAARLKETSTFYKDAVLLRGSEAYTSKQCGRCGTLNDSLNGSETFRCPCGLQCDRDIHAARNILLRFL